MKYEIKPESMTERYKCRKCGSRKCSYYEITNKISGRTYDSVLYMS